jgi:hypothetical protein
LPDIHDEHGGVALHEHLETGISGGRECGDAHGVAGMLTPTALLVVASVMWQAWLALTCSAVLSLTRRRSP